MLKEEGCGSVKQSHTLKVGARGLETNRHGSM